MLTEVARQHHRRGNFDEFGRLKLTQPGYAEPTPVAINLQADSGNRNQHHDQKHQSEDVECRRDVKYFTIVRESDDQHCHQRDAKANQLFDPVAFSWLRIADLDGAKADDGDCHNGQQPVEVAEGSPLDNRYHLEEANKEARKEQLVSDFKSEIGDFKLADLKFEIPSLRFQVCDSQSEFPKSDFSI